MTQPLQVALCGMAPAAAARFQDWLEAHPAMGLQVTLSVPDVDTLLERLSASPSHAVLVDASLGLEGLSLAQELSAAAYAVLCVASLGSPPLVRRRATELGIALCPDADPARIAAALRHLLGLASGAPAAGQIIAFHSPRGGAGTSSLLLHLARTLRDRGGAVAVVELGCCGGAVPLLGLRPGGGWAELRDLSPEGLAGSPEGAQRIAGALVEAEPGLHLMSSAGPAAMDELHPELVEAVLRLLGPCGYSYVLVDTPAEMTVRTAAALTAADVVCLVGLPDAVSAYRLVQVEALLGELQVPPGRVRLVLNRVREQVPPSVEEALAFLPYRPPLRVPEEARLGGDGAGRFSGLRPGGAGARALDRLLEMLLREVDVE